MLELFYIVVIPLIIISLRSGDRVNQVSNDFGFNFHKVYRDGEYYRFLTSLFVHSDLIQFGICLSGFYTMCWNFEQLAYDSNRLFIFLLQLMGMLFVVSWLVWKLVIQVNETLKNGIGRRNIIGLCQLIVTWEIYFACQYGVVTNAMKFQLFIMLFVSDISSLLIGVLAGYLSYFSLNYYPVLMSSNWFYLFAFILVIFFLKSLKMFVVNCLESVGNLLKFFARVIGGQDYHGANTVGHGHQE